MVDRNVFVLGSLCFISLFIIYFLRVCNGICIRLEYLIIIKNILDIIYVFKELIALLGRWDKGKYFINLGIEFFVLDDIKISKIR